MRFGQMTGRRLASKMPSRKITLCQDETFHPEICLVGIEPVSDFIVLETYAKQRDAKTWDAEVTQALAGLPVEVIQSTSDEGRGLLAPVREGLGAHHSPDLFHPQREIGKGLFPRLNAALRRAHRAHEETAQRTQACKQAAEGYQRFPERRGPGRPPDFQKRIAAALHAEEQAHQALDHVKTQQEQVREALQGISDAYHPFDLKSGQWHPVQTVKAEFEQHFAKLDGLAAAIELGERGKACIEKARRLIPQFLVTLTFVFNTMRSYVGELALPVPVEQALYQHLIPALYLRGAATKAPTADKRKVILAVSDTLLAPIRAPDSPLAGWDATELAHIERVATECAHLFQRSSSGVEGRNGHLALWHHHLHTLRPRKLRALTVVHNYFVKRPDGQTPAQHFFGAQHEELFAYLLDRIRLPARQRPRPPPQPLLAAA